MVFGFPAKRTRTGLHVVAAISWGSMKARRAAAIAKPGEAPGIDSCRLELRRSQRNHDQLELRRISRYR
jgi:hypothetical protein